MKMDYKTLTVLVLLSLVLSTTSSAQEFAPLGAKWYFPATAWLSNSTELVTFEGVGDTVINDKTCRILYKDFYTRFGDIGNYYFYQSSDSIFHYDESNDKFDLIIVQSAMPTDTFLVEKTMGYQFPDSMNCIVDSISFINIDNEDSLRVQHVRLVSYKVIESDTFIFEQHKRIIERIGFDYGLLPGPFDWMADGGFIEGDVRCYEDSEIGLVNFSNVDCSYTSTEELDDFNSILVYPNPVYEKLFLEIPVIASNWSYSIYDINGKELWTKKNISGQVGGLIEVDVSNWQSAMYFIKLSDKANQVYYSAKVLKK